MYVKITDKCNMHCAHCCVSATMRGKHMKMPVWKQTIEFLREYGEEYISIGGGEPTLHPKFWHILIDAMTLPGTNVWLATNGSQTETALKLAGLARKGVISCALSLDKWHDPIDPEVESAFQEGKKPGYSYNGNPNDLREIRTVTRIMRVGRAKKLHNTEEGCACEDFVIETNGDIKYCQCENAPVVGNVWTGISRDILDVHSLYECWNEVDFYQEFENADNQ